MFLFEQIFKSTWKNTAINDTNFTCYVIEKRIKQNMYQKFEGNLYLLFMYISISTYKNMTSPSDMDWLSDSKTEMFLFHIAS